MKVKEENEKVGLKLNILKTREESGNSDRCYFLNDSQITVYGDCSHEIKRLTTASAVENVEELELADTADGNIMWYSLF